MGGIFITGQLKLLSNETKIKKSVSNLTLVKPFYLCNLLQLLKK